MGNFPSAPHQRPQAGYDLREDMEEEIRNLARSLRIEAENNTRLIQQKYKRQEQRYASGARSRRHATGRERSKSDDSMRHRWQSKAPEPGQFDPQDMGYHGYSPPRGRSGNRRRPPGAFYPQYPPGREEPGLDEGDIGNLGYNARMGEQYPESDRPEAIPPQQGGPQHNAGRLQPRSFGFLKDKKE